MTETQHKFTLFAQNDVMLWIWHDDNWLVAKQKSLSESHLYESRRMKEQVCINAKVKPDILSSFM